MTARPGPHATPTSPHHTARLRAQAADWDRWATEARQLAMALDHGHPEIAAHLRGEAAATRRHAHIIRDHAEPTGEAVTAPTLTLTVLGLPIGQGAISHGRTGRGYHSNGKLLKPWRNKVTAAAEQATGHHAHFKPPTPKGQKSDRKAKPCVICGVKPGDHGLYTGPIALDVVLTFTPPTKPRHTTPTTRRSGDWDHLGRAISDALTTVLWPDDSQIIDGRVRKAYAGQPGALTEPGALITIREVTG